MNGAKAIAKEITEAYERSFWGGGSIGELFRSFTAEEAAARPIANAHSAWEIALHMASWQTIFVSRMEGDAIPYSEEVDWPSPADTTEETWAAVLEELDGTTAQIAAAVREFDPDRLDEAVPGKEFTFREMLHGVPQHNQYHAGQVRMLRKLLDLRSGE